MRPSLKFLFLDFETYWSDDYTLKKLTPPEYVMDPRFEALGCAFAVDQKVTWVDGPDLPKFLARMPWDQVIAISHNALFDMLILAYRYNVFPAMYGCTLSMARNWLSHQLTSLSLASLSQHYGLAAKMDTVTKTKGINYRLMTSMPWLHDECRRYAIDDASKCAFLFHHMMEEGFPTTELEVIDWVVRMAARPQFELDQGILAEHLHWIQVQKQQLLDACNLNDASPLMSDQMLATQLLHLGVRPIPVKLSKTTGKEAFAFAKTDRDFTDLLEHPEPRVQALVAARLGHKTTLEETRTARLQSIGRVCPNLPVPLKYSGAHTHRFSGDWKINLQNLPRDGELRRTLKAPKGKLVVSVDASQIEARINATLSNETQLVERFRAGEDVYAWFAEKIYGYPVDKQRNKIERFVGKTGILSLGYGSSWEVFQSMCFNLNKVKLTDSEATSIVFLYRQNFKEIVKNWHYANDLVLPMIAQGGEIYWGPGMTEKYALALPNENRLRYRDLRQDQDTDGRWQWRYMRGNRMKRIYGAKLTENLVQALAFIHISEVAMRVKHITEGQLYPAHQVHDELLYVVDENMAELVRDVVVQEMAKPPVWMPDAPLAAEGNFGHTYFHAKLD
jgi:hypothetical protein